MRSARSGLLAGHQAGVRHSDHVAYSVLKTETDVPAEAISPSYGHDRCLTNKTFHPPAAPIRTAG
ncbi:hypothetical protein MPLB_390034 [Mesorhizobium sp. ORS 3324]|nr:hypothetical protein MPLB_390034 [Mesorhizobium sp. ORS 3324]